MGIEHNERTINCGQTSSTDMKKRLLEMRNDPITELTLVDFNHFKQSFMLPFFWPSNINYIWRAFTAIQKNKYIETLRLGAEFVHRFRAYHHGGGSSHTIDLVDLIRMTSLSELSLHTEDWDPKVFKSLQRYLTHEECTLQTLELKGGLTAPELDELRTIIRGSTSLRHYKGPLQKELQAILDAKSPKMEESASFTL